jgi:hypothetical protein
MPVTKKAPARKMVAAKKAPAKKATVVKKAAPVKKAVVAKKAPVKATVRGDVYECHVCGLVVTVNEACGCGFCEIYCCDKSMKPKKARAKAAKK